MDLENLTKQFIESQNTTPLDAFEGFSPQEMYNIIYFPFTSECPIPINTKIANENLKNSPIFKITKYLLMMINEKEGLKLTPKGNLPLKVVTEIYNKRYIIDTMIEEGITKLRGEENWIILHTIKIVLKLSGILRTYKGKLIMTKQTKNDLEKGQFFKLFNKFFQAYTTQFNWAYNDRFGDEEIGQVGFLYLLYLINKYGSTYRDLTFYIDLYLKAFPMFNVEEETLEGIKYIDSEMVIQIRFLERFAYWFGFVEIQYEEHKKFFPQGMRIKRTKLLSKLLSTDST